MAEAPQAAPAPKNASWTNKISSGIESILNSANVITNAVAEHAKWEESLEKREYGAALEREKVSLASSTTSMDLYKSKADELLTTIEDLRTQLSSHVAAKGIDAAVKRLVTLHSEKRVLLQQNTANPPPFDANKAQQLRKTVDANVRGLAAAQTTRRRAEYQEKLAKSKLEQLKRSAAVSKAKADAAAAQRQRVKKEVDRFKEELKMLRSRIKNCRIAHTGMKAAAASLAAAAGGSALFGAAIPAGIMSAIAGVLAIACRIMDPFVKSAEKEVDDLMNLVNNFEKRENEWIQAENTARTELKLIETQENIANQNLSKSQREVQLAQQDEAKWQSELEKSETQLAQAQAQQQQQQQQAASNRTIEEIEEDERNALASDEHAALTKADSLVAALALAEKEVAEHTKNYATETAAHEKNKASVLLAENRLSKYKIVRETAEQFNKQKDEMDEVINIQKLAEVLKQVQQEQQQQKEAQNESAKTAAAAARATAAAAKNKPQQKKTRKKTMKAEADAQAAAVKQAELPV